MRSKKRKASGSADTASPKRARGGGSREVIVIDDDDGENLSAGPPASVDMGDIYQLLLKYARVNSSTIGFVFCSLLFASGSHVLSGRKTNTRYYISL